MRAIVILGVLALSASIAGGAFVVSEEINIPQLTQDAPSEKKGTNISNEYSGENSEKEDSEPQDRISTLNLSCGFQQKVPDTEWDNINVRIEGRALDYPYDAHLEGLIHDRTNEIREAQGLNPLNCDPKLVKIARNHSKDMAKRDFFDHTNPDGENPTDRAEKAGYDCHNRQSFVGENIATRPYPVPNPSPDSGTITYEITTVDKLSREIMNSGLYQSPPHRKNMLTEEWSLMGIGVYVDKEATSSSSRLYQDIVHVTQLFC